MSLTRRGQESPKARYYCMRYPDIQTYWTADQRGIDQRQLVLDGLIWKLTTTPIKCHEGEDQTIIANTLPHTSFL